MSVSSSFHGPAPIGSKNELREFLLEHASLADLYLQHVIDCVSVHDDFGLAVALRKHGLLMKVVHDTYRDLTATKQEAGNARPF
jgi:hypothetical protein